MRRVVVTGMGIVSSIGNNTQEVLSLHGHGRVLCARKNTPSSAFAARCTARLRLTPARCSIAAPCVFTVAGAWNHVAMDQAIDDSGLEPDEVSQRADRAHHGFRGTIDASDRRGGRCHPGKGTEAVGPFAVPKAMCSTASATLSTWFKIKGVSYSISSACATSNHCIGTAYELILMGKQDVVFAGGCEDLDWTLSVLFDAMGAMSSEYNETPSRASRAYDKNRDGFVISGGAGVLVLEDYERAQARGRWIHGEVCGYGATSDGADMVAPSGEGAAAACGRRWNRRECLSTTSIRTRPRRRSATSEKSRRSARYSARAKNVRRSPPLSR